jgi:flagella basal body P-ring formation protein FlgA
VLTLGQIARLDGPDAQALSGLAIEHKARGSVTVDEVRRALDAGGKINWGRITLRGGACELLDPLPRESAAPEPAPARTPDPAPVGADTLQAAIETRMAQILGVAPADLRLTFAPEDAETLRMSTSGRTVEVRPTAMADRIPLRVAVYERDRMVGGERTLRVGVRVKRDVLIASAPRNRGEVLGPGDYTTDSQWLAPTVRPATADQVPGAAAKGRITPGQVIETDDVAPALVVGKGEVVSIRCISGGVVVATRARALGPGRDGEVVEFQAMDSKRRFFGRMDGRGRAVLSAPPAAADPTRPIAGSLPVQGDRLAPPPGLEALR